MAVQNIEDWKEVPWYVQEHGHKLDPVGVHKFWSQAKENDVDEDAGDERDKPDKELLHGWVSVFLYCRLISLQIFDGQHHLNQDDSVDDGEDNVDRIHKDVVYLEYLINVDDGKDDNACEKDESKAHRQDSKEDISSLGKVNGIIKILDIFLAKIVLIQQWHLCRRIVWVTVLYLLHLQFSLKISDIDLSDNLLHGDDKDDGNANIGACAHSVTPLNPVDLIVDIWTAIPSWLAHCQDELQNPSQLLQNSKGIEALYRVVRHLERYNVLAKVEYPKRNIHHHQDAH